MSYQPTAKTSVERVAQTYLENWSEELRRLSFATVLTPLSEEERKALIASYLAWNGDEVAVDEAALSALADRLDALVAQFPDGAFVKLGSRSPKDSWDGAKARFRARNGSDVLLWFRDSERIYEDLHRDNPQYIAIREWRDIPKAEEWRLFVKGRRIVGASQYNYFETYPELFGEAPIVRTAIDWYWPQLRDALPLDDLIVDLWIHQRRQASAIIWEPKFIEINPWGNWTDPCLMSWRDESWQTSEPYEIRIREMPREEVDRV